MSPPIRKKIEFRIQDEEKMRDVLKLTENLIQSMELDISKSTVWRYWFFKGMQENLNEDSQLSKALKGGTE